MSVAFVTSHHLPDLTADDRLAVAALAQRGVSVTPTVWNDDSVDWPTFDAVVVRSTWDYHKHSQEFRAWIERLAVAGARLWNPASVLRWNMHKTYLQALERDGVPVVPTAWLRQGSAATLRLVLDERGWQEVVIKPAISATAFRTWRVSMAEASDAHGRLMELLDAGDVMVQPFMREIQSEGEWSMIFFSGTFSHAVRKRPRDSDFRVQAEFGGTEAAETPSSDVLAAASRVLATVREPWLYARVDGVETARGFVLGELEMLEPSLYLGAHAEAPERFADAIVRVATSA